MAVERIEPYHSYARLGARLVREGPALLEPPAGLPEAVGRLREVNHALHQLTDSEGHYRAYFYGREVTGWAYRFDPRRDLWGQASNLTDRVEQKPIAHEETAAFIRQVADLHRGAALQVYSFESSLGERISAKVAGMRRGMEELIQRAGDPALELKWQSLVAALTDRGPEEFSLVVEPLFESVLADLLVSTALRVMGDRPDPSVERALRYEFPLVAGSLKIGFDSYEVSASDLQGLAEEAYRSADTFPHLLLTSRPYSRHNLLGSHPSVAEYLRSITYNLRGARTVLGDVAYPLLYGTRLLTTPLRNREGGETRFSLVVEPGEHETHGGLQLAIYEGLQTGQLNGYLAKVGLHFGPEGSLRIINIQGVTRRAAEHGVRILSDINYQNRKGLTLDQVSKVLDERGWGNRGVVEDYYAHQHEEKFVPGGFDTTLLEACLRRQRERFQENFGGGSTSDLLVAAAILLAGRWGFHRVEGIRDGAQVARADQVATGKIGPSFYDLFFRRFEFRRPKPESDYWTLRLGRHPALEDYFATVLPRSNRDRPRVWRDQPADPSSPRVIAFLKSIAPALSQMSWAAFSSTVDLPTDPVDLTRRS